MHILLPALALICTVVWIGFTFWLYRNMVRTGNDFNHQLTKITPLSPLIPMLLTVKPLQPLIQNQLPEFTTLLDILGKHLHIHDVFNTTLRCIISKTNGDAIVIDYVLVGETFARKVEMEEGVDVRYLQDLHEVHVSVRFLSKDPEYRYHQLNIGWRKNVEGDVVLNAMTVDYPTQNASQFLLDATHAA